MLLTFDISVKRWRRTCSRKGVNASTINDRNAPCRHCAARALAARSTGATRSLTPMNKSLRRWIQLIATLGALVILQSLVSLQTTPQRYEWLFFAALAILTGSFSMKIGSVYASVTIADTFFITTALLFGPAPATLAIALGTSVASWRRGHDRARVAFNTATTSLGIWAGSHVFFLLAGVPPLALTQVQAPAGQVSLPLLALTGVYFLTNSGLIAVAIGLDARRSPIAVWREHFLWLSVELLRGCVRIVLPRIADVPGESSRGDCLSAAARRAAPDAALVVRAPRRCAPASRASRSPVSVDGRNARHGDRRQRRRDAQPRATRAGVCARARPRARRDGRTHTEGHRSGGAAARHGEARGARAHSQQARQTLRGGVRADEAPRRRWRRHSFARRFPVPRCADRPVPSRELGWQRVPARRCRH